MADESNPKASFLGGKQAAPVQPAAPPVQESPIPAAAPSGASPGFLKGKGTPAAVAVAARAPAPVVANAPAPVAPNPVVTSPAVAKPAGNRALAEQYLKRGLDHYENQEADSALAAFKQCIQADVAFGMGYNNLGMVLIDLERYDEAVDALYESIRCDSNYAEAYNNLGFVLRRMQRPVEAASAYSRSLALEPDVEESGRIRGWVESVARDNGLEKLPPFELPPAPGQEPQPEAVPAPVEAPQEIQKVKKMSAWEAAAGDIATAAPVSALGEIEDAAPAPAPVTAAPAFAKAPVAPPSPPPAPVAAAPIAPRPTLPKIGSTRPAAPAPPAAPAATVIELVERGMDQFAEGNLSEASSIFEQAIALDPDNPEGHIGLGKVWIRQERMDEAIPVLQKAVGLDEEEPAGWYVLGFALRAMERNVEAAHAYEKFLTLMPEARDSEKMFQWIAHVTSLAGLSSGVHEEVIDDEQIVTDSDKKYKKALTKFQEGDADGSLRDCIKILTEDPGHLRTRVVLGRCYLRQKAYDNAAEQFDNALKIRPDYPEALYFLGQAAEKKGDLDQAGSNYKRYREVAPNGPRAERLREWLMTQGPQSSSIVTGQVQCELCLRFFPGVSISQHEGKATCHNCMKVMGALPGDATTADGGPAPITPPPPDSLSSKPRKSKGLVMVGLLLLLLAGGGAAAWKMNKLDPVLIKLGLLKPPPPPPPKIIPVVEVTPTVAVFDKTKVKIANEPLTRVKPFSKWTYSPALEGVEELNKHYPGWKAEVSVSGAPKEMLADPKVDFSKGVGEGALVWMHSASDFEALKKGEQLKVEMQIKFSGKGADGAPLELQLSKTFTMNTYFGYEMGPEIETGIPPSENVAVASGEFTGDNIPEAVIASGAFRRGGLRMYVQRKNNPLPAPSLLDSGTRFSALNVQDFDGNKSHDLLAADWRRSRLKMFYNDGQLTPGPEVEVGRGPLDICAADLDGDHKIKIAALCGAGSTLSLTSLEDRKFGPVVEVPLAASGPYGFVLPWKNAFLAITPLSADAPLQLVRFEKRAWAKSAITSPLDGGGLVRAVAVLMSSGGSVRRLALLIHEKNASRLVLFDEKDGKFSPASAALQLPDAGVGLLAHDFNSDGEQDLCVIMQNETAFYFSSGARLLPGPTHKSSVRLLGPATLFGSADAVRPDILLINEARKAHILKSVEVEFPEPVAPAPTPAVPGTAAPADKTPAAPAGEKPPAEPGAPKPPATEPIPPAPPQAGN